MEAASSFPYGTSESLDLLIAEATKLSVCNATGQGSAAPLAAVAERNRWQQGGENTTCHGRKQYSRPEETTGKSKGAGKDVWNEQPKPPTGLEAKPCLWLAPQETFYKQWQAVGKEEARQERDL